MFLKIPLTYVINGEIDGTQLRSFIVFMVLENTLLVTGKETNPVTYKSALPARYIGAIVPQMLWE